MLREAQTECRINNKELISFVAEYVTAEEQGRYKVYSVDKYGNCLI